MILLSFRKLEVKILESRLTVQQDIQLQGEDSQTSIILKMMKMLRTLVVMVGIVRKIDRTQIRNVMLFVGTRI